MCEWEHYICKSVRVGNRSCARTQMKRLSHANLELQSNFCPNIPRCQYFPLFPYILHFLPPQSLLIPFVYVFTVFLVPLLETSLKSNSGKQNTEIENETFILPKPDKQLEAVPQRKQNKNSFLYLFSRISSAPHPSLLFLLEEKLLTVVYFYTKVCEKHQYQNCILIIS